MYGKIQLHFLAGPSIVFIGLGKKHFENELVHTTRVQSHYSPTCNHIADLCLRASRKACSTVCIDTRGTNWRNRKAVTAAKRRCISSSDRNRQLFGTPTNVQPWRKTWGSEC